MTNVAMKSPNRVAYIASPIQLVDQLKVKANAPYIQLAKEIFSELEISNKAVAIFDEMVFLLRNGMTKVDYMNQYNSQKRKIHVSALTAQRKKLIDRTRFASFDEFLTAYQTNPQSALEQEFGEEICQGRARYIPVDLMSLYYWHTENRYENLMNTPLYW